MIWKIWAFYLKFRCIISTQNNTPTHTNQSPIIFEYKLAATEKMCAQLASINKMQHPMSTAINTIYSKLQFLRAKARNIGEIPEFEKERVHLQSQLITLKN